MKNLYLLSLHIIYNIVCFLKNKKGDLHEKISMHRMWLYL